MPKRRGVLASGGILRIYHGSPDPNMIPEYGGGKEYHDYGKGFYCVEDEEMAKEWACQHNDTAVSFVYVYELDLAGLRPVLDLNACAPAYWLSALASHRYVSKEGALLRQRRERFIEAFPVDYEGADIIRGWRANDQYFAYLRDFLRMDISYEAVVEAMKLGDLGQQIVLKSERAFANCRQADRITIADNDYKMFFEQYKERDFIARTAMDSARELSGRSIEELISRSAVENNK